MMITSKSRGVPSRRFIGSLLSVREQSAAAQQPVRVKAPLDVLHCLDLIGRILDGEQVRLALAEAMLGADRASQGDRFAREAGHHFFAALELKARLWKTVDVQMSV